PHLAVPCGVSQRVGSVVPGRGRHRGAGLFRHEGTARHVPTGSRNAVVTATHDNAGARVGAGGSVDRHRVARHHGGGSTQRQRRGRRGRRASGTAGGHTGGSAMTADAVTSRANTTPSDVDVPSSSGLPDEAGTARELVEPGLRAAVEELDPEIRDVVRYHLGWVDRSGNPVTGGGGKALRPALTVLCAQAAGVDPGAAVPGAVAVELVHNFSLLHDDVMDGDTERRS